MISTPKPPAWSAAVDQFAAVLEEEERSRHTIANYRDDLVAFAAWYEQQHGPPSLDSITASELREWKTELRDKRKFEPATVNRKLSALRSFLKWCKGAGLADQIAVPKSIKEGERAPRWLTAIEQKRLLRAVEKGKSARDVAIVGLLLHTGIRVDELVALRWKDLKIQERSGELIVRAGKGKKQRLVPLNAEARHALSELGGKKHQGEDVPVLHGQRGPMTVRGVQNTLEKYRAPAKIDDLSPHALRHTFGKNLADNGVPIQVIAALMGHESIQTTRRYVSPGRDDLAAAVDSLAGGED